MALLLIIIHGIHNIISRLQNHKLPSKVQIQLFITLTAQGLASMRVIVGLNRHETGVVQVGVGIGEYFREINFISNDKILSGIVVWELGIYYDKISNSSLSSYYIRQIKSLAMKPKKKAGPTNKKASKKIGPSKNIQFLDKNITTTKEKTHNTTEEIFQIYDTKPTLTQNKKHLSRLSCIQKMQQYNLSPFSSPDALSISPRYKKTSPSRDQKECKKTKERLMLHLQKATPKPKVQLSKKNPKLKGKMSKQESNQVAYQTLLLRKMNQKKITELSQESSLSLTKINLPLKSMKESYAVKKAKSKCAHIRELKQKVQEKYYKELPNLKPSELKFYCAIVLVQRLWRQRKIKSLISEFITPRHHHETHINRLANTSKLDITTTTQEQTEELIRKYHHISPQKKENADKEVHSTEIVTSDKKVNLKGLELQQEMTKEQGQKMVRFVDCLRDISFSRPKKGAKTHKINVFNLQESLSEKCIMQKFYERIFDDSPAKKNNFEIFSLKKEGRHLQRSIELINTMKSPQRVESITAEDPFETQLPTEETPTFQKKETFEKQVQTDNAICAPQTTEITTLKNLYNISEDIIYSILNEFAEEFFKFTSQTVLKKKKKSRLPGLRVTAISIRQYLNGLCKYMLDTYEAQVTRRYSLINPLSFLKIHHEYQDEDEQAMSQEEDMNMPIVPNTLFYEYELIYESEKFIIEEDNRKYSNFLEGLIKIHNLLLANCLSEILEKHRIDRVILPWDNKFKPRPLNSSKLVRKTLQTQLDEIVENICSCAFLRIGQFHKRLDDPHEQQKILSTINQQYKSEGSQWCAQYQHLEIRMQLSKSIEQILWQQTLREMVIFF